MVQHQKCVSIINKPIQDQKASDTFLAECGEIFIAPTPRRIEVRAGFILSHYSKDVHVLEGAHISYYFSDKVLKIIQIIQKSSDL